MGTPEEAELARWGIWTPSGSVTPREYLASRPAADQIRAQLNLLLDQPDRYRALIRAFAEHLGLNRDDLNALYAERHPRRRAAFIVEHGVPGEHRSTPPPIQEASQAMRGGGNGDGHGEHPAEAAGEHPAHAASAERRRHTLTPETGAMLRAARGRCGWSVRQAAARVGVAGGTIGMLESATRAPSLQVAERLVDVYQLTDDEAAQLLREAVPETGRQAATNDR